MARNEQDWEVFDVVDDGPLFEEPLADILSQFQNGDVLRLVPAEKYVSGAMGRWYWGPCLNELATNGETKYEWDYRLKMLCGASVLNREMVFCGLDAFGKAIPIERLTTKKVGKKKMCEYVENILSRAITEGWPVYPPDPELRTKRMDEILADKEKRP